VTDLGERAARLDAADPLAGYRERFVIDDELIYLDGNSLGRPPKAAVEDVISTMRSEWARDLVVGWDRWLDLGLRLGDDLAGLIGADHGEVAICDQTSVNLFKLATAALDNADGRDILTDAGNFPSDLYVLSTVARRGGGRLIVIDEDPEPSDIDAHLDPSVGLVALSHVAYRSGALLDAEAISRIARANGSFMLWDLAHSAGVVPIDLDAWGAELAVGCTYKYLNGGPGSPGFLYVRKDLQASLDQPITGWFAHDDQFGFRREFTPSDTIRRFLVGTPPILSMAAVAAGIDLTVDAGIAAIRAKSQSLSTLFIEAVDSLDVSHGLDVATPRSPERRGSHVSLRHPDGLRIAGALRDEGVVPDFREPDLVRFGFAPLYTSHAEVVDAVVVLDTVLTSATHRSRDGSRRGVT
jgi:kynureninase